MKKASLFIRIFSTVLAGLFAAGAFFAGHAELFLPRAEKEEDPVARTARYKTKNGWITVGGTGLRLRR